MTFVIRFIKDLEFVATENFSGTLEEASRFASDGLKKHGAETAAIMDASNMKGAPIAVVE